MAKINPHLDQYRKNSVNGASPLQLVIMLYDGALRFMNSGKRAMEAGNTFEQNVNLQKAQKIVAELISCLDMEKGGEIAQNLFALYSFCYNGLVDANVQDKPEPVDHAIQVLTNLKTSWVELEKQTRIKSGTESHAA